MVVIAVAIVPPTASIPIATMRVIAALDVDRSVTAISDAKATRTAMLASAAAPPGLGGRYGSQCDRRCQANECYRFHGVSPLLGRNVTRLVLFESAQARNNRHMA
jgi:hypothetical protein